jgi:hypothetical protein
MIIDWLFLPQLDGAGAGIPSAPAGLPRSGPEAGVHVETPGG